MTQPKIVLYGIAGTPYTEKVIRALRFKGLAFASREPSSAEEIRRWSPETGLLPVIEIDGERVADSAAILDRLDARFPDPPLHSADPKVARDQRRLEAWVSETFGYYMNRWVARKLGLEDTGPREDEEGNRLGPLARMGLIGEDGRLRPEAFDTRDGGPGPEFERRLGDLASLLGDREWFHGDRLSRADLSVFSAVFGMYSERFPGGRRVLARFPALLRHAERVDAATASAPPPAS